MDPSWDVLDCEEERQKVFDEEIAGDMAKAMLAMTGAKKGNQIRKWLYSESRKYETKCNDEFSNIMRCYEEIYQSNDEMLKEMDRRMKILEWLYGFRNIMMCYEEICQSGDEVLEKGDYAAQSQADSAVGNRGTAKGTGSGPPESGWPLPVGCSGERHCTALQ